MKSSPIELNAGRALGIAAGIAVLAILLQVGGAGAATLISSCTTISSPGTYVLNQSIVNSGAFSCINITSSNVAFDGAGYTIDGVDAGSTYGVHVYNHTSLTNVIVENLTVTDWGIGIFYNNSANGTITNNTVSSNGNGIVLVNSSNNNTLSKAYQHLAEVMDKYHQSFDVYTDVGVAGNHFVHRAMMGTDVTINDAFTETVHSGATAIKNTFSPSSSGSWGGWYFQNGVLLDNDVKPCSNWGDYPDAGINLSGAPKLIFWAKGEKGGEKVEFFAFGIGRDPVTGNPIKPYPDSSPKVSVGYITLSNIWTQYTIDLTGKDLSYVLGGFGWVTNAPNNNNQDITFYLDDIRYDKPHLNDLRLLVSYETIPSNQDFDIVLRNVAFTYDNALALIGFTAAEDWDRARVLADALVYAQAHDRYYTDGRLRNAYQAGDLISPPGWTPNNHVGTVRMPGWWNATEQKWYEGEENVGSSTGNLAWTMVALINYYEKRGGEQYLAAASTLGNWIETHTHDTRGVGGYSGGYTGWEPNPTKLFWKSTEHNLDIYVAFERLYRISGNATWHQRALHAKGFVDAMWNPEAGHFWTGTLSDGMSINPQAIPLDAQTWALLALAESEKTRAAITFAERNHNASYGDYEGFDFNTDRDMPWSEGTAQMVVAYWVLGNFTQAQFYIDELRHVQATAPNGNSKGIVAAPADGLTTGFDWLYFNRLHVGATAWYVFAEQRYNPYWQTTLLGNNKIYYNNFINNTNQAHDYINNNSWDNGYPSGGNYWSDYTGIDANNDSIGDTPYNISGAGAQDRYPFMTMYGWLSLVRNPNAIPSAIPDDTDNNATCSGTICSEVTRLNVSVSDASGVAGVRINLSAIGGQAVQPMTLIAGDSFSGIWSATTSASAGAVGLHSLQVNATDVWGNSNTSVDIILRVVLNGDANNDGSRTLADASYLAKAVLSKLGFVLTYPGVGDVNGDCAITLADASFLAKNVLGKPGFSPLK